MPLFESLLIIFAASAVVVTLLSRTGIPPTLGYFVVGLALGPTALGVVSDQQAILRIAELGVVFLLFTLGLEFSLPRMIALRTAVFGVGTGQALICALIFGGVMYLAQLPLLPALLVGGALALSSTAIALREIRESGQLHEPQGVLSFAVLLLQDLFAVLLLMLVPTLQGAGDGDPWALARAFGYIVVLAMGLLAAGRWLLPHWFNAVLRTRADELFVLTALVLALASGWFAEHLGLSMGLGAFFAGAALGESHHRHRLEADVRPFRDLLLGVFFAAVGMMLDVQMLLAYWPRILAFGVTLMCVKVVVVYVLGKWAGYSPHASLRAGLALAQGGEFSIAIFALLANRQLIPLNVHAFMVAVTVASMLFAPPLIRRGDRMARFVLGEERSLHPPPQTTERRGHVVLLGYGRVGQIIARALGEKHIAWVAIDRDLSLFEESRLLGDEVLLGDVRQTGLLEAAAVEHARLVVVATGVRSDSLLAVQAIRKLAPEVPILVRASDDRDVELLQLDGKTEVVPETLESALTLVTHALTLSGISAREVRALVHRTRRNRYQWLKGVLLDDQTDGLDERVLPVFLPVGSFAVGKALASVRALTAPALIRSVRRGERDLRVADDLVLDADDVVTLSGTSDALEAAEDRLLSR